MASHSVTFAPGACVCFGNLDFVFIADGDLEPLNRPAPLITPASTSSAKFSLYSAINALATLHLNASNHRIPNDARLIDLDRGLLWR